MAKAFQLLFSRYTLVILACASASMLALPLVLGAIWVKVLTSVTIFAIAAAGTSLVYAQLRLVNLAQVALVGVGGWIMLRLNHGTAFPFEVSLLLSGAGAGLVGMLLAIPAMRMRGLYLALVTLMAAGAFQIIFTAFQFPNGGDGFWGVALQSPGEMRRPLLAPGDEAYLRYTIAVAAICFIIVHLHQETRSGRAWAMIRQSEANAMAAGVDVTVYKVRAFVLAGFLAGIAGGLLAGALKILDSRSFAAGESVLLFAVSVVGGVYGWLGAVIAGLLYRGVPALFNNLGQDADLSLIIFGAALLHAIITAERGLAGQIADAFDGLRRKREETQ
ncbi:branched-chain amino acid ABC transporter permease [Hoeflea sp. CAU 1731]